MENVFSKIQEHIDNGLYQGLEWKINYKKNIFQGKIGYSDLTTKSLVKENSIYRIWSMTKPIISIVILQLIEEKKIKFEDSLNYFLPVFNDLKVLKKDFNSIHDVENVKNMPTIKNLLLHTAGFSYNFLGDIIGEKYHQVGLFHSEKTTLEEEIDLLATIPLLYEPEKKWVYSVSIDILARIIEVVTGNTLQEELKKRIFKPLGMIDTGFIINEENNYRLMKSYHYDSIKKKLIDPLTHPRKISNYGYPADRTTFARGGIGLFSTVNDYSKFAQMLLSGKAENNQIIISNTMLKLATTNQISSAFLPYEIKNFDLKKIDENLFEPYGFGYGFRVMMNLQNKIEFGSIGEFGWGGAASTFFLVDPSNDLTAVLMTQVFEGDPILLKDFIKIIYKNLE